MVLVSLSVFLKVTGRKGYMLYVPMVMMLVVTMTSLGMSVYNICLKLFVTGGFVFMTDGLQLFFAILLMALGLMIFIGSGKKLVQPVEKGKASRTRTKRIKQSRPHQAVFSFTKIDKDDGSVKMVEKRTRTTCCPSLISATNRFRVYIVP